MSTPRAHTFRLVLAIVLAVALVVLAAALAWLRLTAGDEEEAAAAQREDLMSVSSQFLLRMGTYGPDLLDEGSGQMPEYRERVGELITPKFKASFDEQVATAEQLVAQGASSSAEVFSTGVASMDDDSARTLVAGVFEPAFTRDGETVEQEPGPFRIELSLVRADDGRWLVDDFTPITGGAADDSGTGGLPGTEPGAEPGAEPSAQPSGGGS